MLQMFFQHYHRVLDEPEDAARFWEIKPATVPKKVLVFEAT